MPERHLKAVPTPDQPQLYTDPERTGPRICGWCDKRAVTTVMVSPAQFTGAGTRRRLIRKATYANACREHRHLSYDPLAGRAEARAERQRLKLANQQQTTITDFLGQDLRDPGA